MMETFGLGKEALEDSSKGVNRAWNNLQEAHELLHKSGVVVNVTVGKTPADLLLAVSQTNKIIDDNQILIKLHDKYGAVSNTMAICKRYLEEAGMPISQIYGDPLQTAPAYFPKKKTKVGLAETKRTRSYTKQTIKEVTTAESFPEWNLFRSTSTTGKTMFTIQASAVKKMGSIITTYINTTTLDTVADEIGIAKWSLERFMDPSKKSSIFESSTLKSILTYYNKVILQSDAVKQTLTSPLVTKAQKEVQYLLRQIEQPEVSSSQDRFFNPTSAQSTMTNRRVSRADKPRTQTRHSEVLTTSQADTLSASSTKVSLDLGDIWAIQKLAAQTTLTKEKFVEVLHATDQDARVLDSVGPRSPLSERNKEISEHVIVKFLGHVAENIQLTASLERHFNKVRSLISNRIADVVDAPADIHEETDTKKLESTDMPTNIESPNTSSEVSTATPADESSKDSQPLSQNDETQSNAATPEVRSEPEIVAGMRSMFHNEYGDPNLIRTDRANVKASTLQDYSQESSLEEKVETIRLGFTEHIALKHLLQYLSITPQSIGELLQVTKAESDMVFRKIGARSAQRWTDFPKPLLISLLEYITERSDSLDVLRHAQLITLKPFRKLLHKHVEEYKTRPVDTHIEDEITQQSDEVSILKDLPHQEIDRHESKAESLSPASHTDEEFNALSARYKQLEAEFHGYKHNKEHLSSTATSALNMLETRIEHAKIQLRKAYFDQQAAFLTQRAEIIEDILRTLAPQLLAWAALTNEAVYEPISTFPIDIRDVPAAADSILKMKQDTKTAGLKVEEVIDQTRRLLSLYAVAYPFKSQNT